MGSLCMQVRRPDPLQMAPTLKGAPVPAKQQFSLAAQAGLPADMIPAYLPQRGHPAEQLREQQSIPAGREQSPLCRISGPFTLQNQTPHTTVAPVCSSSTACAPCLQLQAELMSEENLSVWCIIQQAPFTYRRSSYYYAATCKQSRLGRVHIHIHAAAATCCAPASI